MSGKFFTHAMTFERSLYDEPALYDRVVAPPAASLGFYLDEASRGGGDVLELACGRAD